MKNSMHDDWVTRLFTGQSVMQAVHAMSWPEPDSQNEGLQDRHAAHMEQRATVNDSHDHICPRCKLAYECPRPEICNATDGDWIICNDCLPDEEAQ